MQVTIMTTNGGPHPADKWALVTAQHLLPIDPAVVGDRWLAAQKLQLAVAEALVDHHTNVQDQERGHLQTKGDARLAEPLGAAEHVDAAYASIVAAAKGTLWEAHVLKAEVEAAMRDVLRSHFKTVQDIERKWHADRAASQ